MNCVSSIQICKIKIDIVCSKLRSLVSADEKFSCLRCQSGMFVAAEVLHGIPYKTQFVRSYLLNTLIHMKRVNELQEAMRNDITRFRGNTHCLSDWSIASTLHELFKKKNKKNLSATASVCMVNPPGANLYLQP